MRPEEALAALTARRRPFAPRVRPTKGRCFACGWVDHPQGVRVYRYRLLRTLWDPRRAEGRGMARGAGVVTHIYGSLSVCDRCLSEAQTPLGLGA